MSARRIKLKKPPLDPTEHKYYPRVMAALAQHPEWRAAGVHDIDISHDDWCAIYKGGYCNCNPHISRRVPNQKATQ